MEIKESHTAGIIVLEISGRLDSSSAAKLSKWMEASLPNSAALLAVGMQEITFIDSTGLSVLVQAMKRCRERQGSLVLYGMQQSVRMIFELTRLNKAFDIFVNQTEALTGLA
jgi:anti-sigma B factor antagonist